MRRSKVKKGLFVVIKGAEFPQVYRVEAIDNFTVKLSYPVSGHEAIGYGDCSLIEPASEEQLRDFLESQR